MYFRPIFDLFYPRPPKPTFDLFLTYFNVLGVSRPLGGRLLHKAKARFTDSMVFLFPDCRGTAWSQAKTCGEASLAHRAGELTSGMSRRNGAAPDDPQCRDTQRSRLSLEYQAVGNYYLKYSWECFMLEKAPTSQKSLSGPSGPKCPGECPTRCPRKWGVSGALRAPGSGVSRRCPESVPGVSGHLFDTLRTRFWHPEFGAQRAPETPRGTLPRTPPFSGTPCRTLSGTLRARKTLLAGRGFPNLLQNNNA